MEYRIVRPDGAVRWLRDRGRGIDRPDGGLAYFTGVAVDVTELKQVEQEREASLARLHTLIRVSTEILAEKTLEGLLQRIVDAACVLTGARIGTTGYGNRNDPLLVGPASEVEDTMPCPPVPPFRAAHGGVQLNLDGMHNTIRLTDEELHNHPLWLGVPEGHDRLRGMLGAGLIGNGGRACGLIMVSDKAEGDFTAEDEALLAQLAAIASLGMRHIEARDAVEARAREAEQGRLLLEDAECERVQLLEEVDLQRLEAERQAAQLSAILENLREGVVVLDGAGQLILTNHKAREIGGGSLGLDGIHGDVRLASLDGTPVSREQWPLDRLLQGEHFSDREFILEKPDGTKLRVILSGSTVSDGDGQVALAIITYHDVTELRQLEQSQIEYLRIISHELRQPLTVITAQAQLAERVADKPERVRKSTQSHYYHGLAHEHHDPGPGRLGAA